LTADRQPLPDLLGQLRASTLAIGYDGVIYEFAAIAFAQGDVCRLQYQDAAASRAWNKDGSRVELAALKEPRCAPDDRYLHRRTLSAVIDELGLSAALQAVADLADEESEQLWAAGQRRLAKQAAEARRLLHLASREVSHGNEAVPPLPRRLPARPTPPRPQPRPVIDEDFDPLADLLAADAR
jgi:hypothetical protein